MLRTSATNISVRNEDAAASGTIAVLNRLRRSSQVSIAPVVFRCRSISHHTKLGHVVNKSVGVTAKKELRAEHWVYNVGANGTLNSWAG